jgi:hypothetical protein
MFIQFRIEQELMARFVNTLVNPAEEPKGYKDPVVENSYQSDDDDDQPSQYSLSMNENTICKALFV